MQIGFFIVYLQYLKTNYMLRGFDNYVIDSELYYLIFEYNAANHFMPTGGRKLSMLTKDEVLKLADDAIEYFKKSVKTIAEYVNEQ